MLNVRERTCYSFALYNVCEPAEFRFGSTVSFSLRYASLKRTNLRANHIFSQKTNLQSYSLYGFSGLYFAIEVGVVKWVNQEFDVPD